METITPAVKTARFTNQSNGTHHIILLSESEMLAESVRYILGGSIKLSYVLNPKVDKYYLNFELSDTDKHFLVAVDETPETVQWKDWIDNGVVTEVCPAYPDKDGKLVSFGESIRLRI